MMVVGIVVAVVALVGLMVAVIAFGESEGRDRDDEDISP